MVGRRIVQPMPCCSQPAISRYPPSADRRGYSRSAAISESILMMMLVEVNTTTRFNAVQSRCSNTSASRPTSAVQYSVSQAAISNASGAPRSSSIQSTARCGAALVTTPSAVHRLLRDVAQYSRWQFRGTYDETFHSDQSITAACAGHASSGRVIRESLSSLAPARQSRR